jgi:hypothetical protein
MNEPPSMQELNTPELSDFQRDLAALCPRPSRVDREALLRTLRATARQAAAGPSWRRWIWPAATAVVTAAAGVLGLLLLLQRPQIVRETVYIERPAEAVSIQPRSVPPPTESVLPELPPAADRDAGLERPPRENYLHTRGLVLSLGLDALPSTLRGAGASPASAQTIPQALAELGIRISRPVASRPSALWEPTP